MNEARIGTATSTGAAINVELGWLPDKVALLNQTTGKTMVWYRSMGDGKGLVGGTTAAALITTNGVSAYNGSGTVGQGFTIGTDGINPSGGNVIAFEAVRNAD